MFELSREGYIEGTVENYKEYVKTKNKYKKDKEKHVLNMKDINTFPKPETYVEAYVGCGHLRKVIARVGVTGISWLWDVLEDSEYEDSPMNEFMHDGQEWRYKTE